MAGSPLDSVGPAAATRRPDITLMAELLIRRAFQLANALLLIETLRASSDLTVVWSGRVLLLEAVAAAWFIGTVYLWFRAWWRLPRYWYVLPLTWSVVLLVIGLGLPQTLRFRLVGDDAFTEYIATNTVNAETQLVDADVGSYHIEATERVGDVIVFHGESEVDWLADDTVCGALLHLEPADIDAWQPAFDGLPFRRLGGDWWLVNFTTRGVYCHQMFDVSLRPGSGG